MTKHFLAVFDQTHTAMVSATIPESSRSSAAKRKMASASLVQQMSGLNVGSFKSSRAKNEKSSSVSLSRRAKVNHRSRTREKQTSRDAESLTKKALRYVLQNADELYSAKIMMEFPRKKGATISNTFSHITEGDKTPGFLEAATDAVEGMMSGVSNFLAGGSKKNNGVSESDVILAFKALAKVTDAEMSSGGKLDAAFDLKSGNPLGRVFGLAKSMNEPLGTSREATKRLLKTANKDFRVSSGAVDFAGSFIAATVALLVGLSFYAKSLAPSSKKKKLESIDFQNALNYAGEANSNTTFASTFALVPLLTNGATTVPMVGGAPGTSQIASMGEMLMGAEKQKGGTRASSQRKVQDMNKMTSAFDFGCSVVRGGKEVRSHDRRCREIYAGKTRQGVPKWTHGFGHGEDYESTKGGYKRPDERYNYNY